MDTFRFLHHNTKTLILNGPFDGWQSLLKDKRDAILRKFQPGLSELKISSKISDGTLCNDDFDLNVEMRYPEQVMEKISLLDIEGYTFKNVLEKIVDFGSLRKLTFKERIRFYENFSDEEEYNFRNLKKVEHLTVVSNESRGCLIFNLKHTL